MPTVHAAGTIGAVRVVDVELGPVERQLRVVYLGAAQVEGWLHVGDRLKLRDEGGVLHAGTVEAVEGRRYRVVIEVEFTDADLREIRREMGEGMGEDLER